MTNKRKRTSQRTKRLIDELIWIEHGQATKGVCIIAPIECNSGYKYFLLRMATPSSMAASRFKYNT